MHTHIHTHAHPRTRTHTHTHTHTPTPTPTPTHIHTRTHTHTHHTHTHTHAHTHTHTHTPRHTPRHTPTHTHTRPHTHAHTHTHMCFQNRSYSTFTQQPYRAQAFASFISSSCSPVLSSLSHYPIFFASRFSGGDGCSCSPRLRPQTFGVFAHQHDHIARRHDHSRPRRASCRYRSHVPVPSSA